MRAKMWPTIYLILVLFMVAMKTVDAAVWACPTKPPTYQDMPCAGPQGDGREVEVRGTVVSLNVRPEPSYAGPRSFTVGRRSDDLPSTSAMIQAYREDTSIRNFDPLIPNYTYGVPVYVNNPRLRNQLRK